MSYIRDFTVCVNELGHWSLISTSLPVPNLHKNCKNLTRTRGYQDNGSLMLWPLGNLPGHFHSIHFHSQDMLFHHVFFHCWAYLIRAQVYHPLDLWGPFYPHGLTNPIVDKWLHPLLDLGWNYLSIFKLVHVHIMMGVITCPCWDQS